MVRRFVTLFISLGKAALLFSFLTLICVFSTDLQKRDLDTDLLSNAAAKGSEVSGDRPDCPLKFSFFPVCNFSCLSDSDVACVLTVFKP